MNATNLDKAIDFWNTMPILKRELMWIDQTVVCSKGRLAKSATAEEIVQIYLDHSRTKTTEGSK